MNLTVTFILLNIANVIIQTVKSICTIKCNKYVASVVNAVAYGLYTIVVVYTVCDLNLWFKVAVVAIANLIGVFTVKFFEEKAQKDKLWKIETTFSKPQFEKFINEYDIKVPHNYIDVGKYVIVNFYCKTQKDTKTVKEFLTRYNVKYFVSESKVSTL